MFEILRSPSRQRGSSEVSEDSAQVERDFVGFRTRGGARNPPESYEPYAESYGIPFAERFRRIPRRGFRRIPGGFRRVSEDSVGFRRIPRPTPLAGRNPGARGILRNPPPREVS